MLPRIIESLRKRDLIGYLGYNWLEDLLLIFQMWPHTYGLGHVSNVTCGRLLFV